MNSGSLWRVLWSSYMLLICHTKYCHSMKAEQTVPQAVHHMFLFSNSKGFSNFLQGIPLLLYKLTSPLVPIVLLFGRQCAFKRCYMLLYAAFARSRLSQYCNKILTEWKTIFPALPDMYAFISFLRKLKQVILPTAFLLLPPKLRKAFGCLFWKYKTFFFCFFFFQCSSVKQSAKCLPNTLSSNYTAPQCPKMCG